MGRKRILRLVRLYVLLCVAIMLPATLTGCGTQQVQRSVSGLAVIDPQGELVIVNGNGDVTVRTHASPGIKVELEKKAGAVSADRVRAILADTDVVMSQQNALVKVQTVKPAISTGESISTTLTIWVPQNFSGTITTTNGNGAIRIYGLGGTGNFSTGNGDITVEAWYGRLTVETKNGGVAVKSVRLTADSRFTAANGAINLDLQALQADVTAITVNGTIKVIMPRGTGADVDAAVVNGKIKLTQQGNTVYQGDGMLKRQLNGGGHALLLQTANGGITVEER